MINTDQLNSQVNQTQINTNERVFESNPQRSVSINSRFMIFKDNNKKTQISLFLVKMYESLMKEDHPDIWCWSSSGDCIQIKNIPALETTIQAKLFKHNKFTSFQRQLHSYDFKKVFHKEDVCVFRNPYFKKGKFTSLKNIKRKSPGITNNTTIKNNQSLQTVFSSVKKIWNKLVSELDFESCINIFKMLSIPKSENFIKSYDLLKELDFIKAFSNGYTEQDDHIVNKNYELIMCLMIFHQNENMKTEINTEQIELIKGLTGLYLNNMQNFL